MQEVYAMTMKDISDEDNEPLSFPVEYVPASTITYSSNRSSMTNIEIDATRHGDDGRVSNIMGQSGTKR